MKKIALLLYLIILALFDLREQKVPLILLTGGGAAAWGIHICMLLQNPAKWSWLVLSILLGILPGLLLLAVARLTGKAGYGDGLALLNVGLLTDYKTCLLMLCFSMLSMSLLSVGMLSVKRVRRETRLPYLPFLAGVYAVGLLF